VPARKSGIVAMRRKNIVLAVVLALAALGMYLGLFIKMS